MIKSIPALIGLLIVCSCSKQQEFVEESFSMRLVHPDNPQTTDRGLVNGIDLSGFFPLKANPLVKSDNQSEIYWVSEKELLGTSELHSANVVIESVSKYLPSKEEYVEQERQLQSEFPNMTMDSYENFLKNNSPPPSSLNLTFTDLGTAKLSQVTRENMGSKLAIVIDNKVIAAPYIREGINSGNIMAGLSCSQNTAKEIIRVMIRDM